MRKIISTCLLGLTLVTAFDAAVASTRNVLFKASPTLEFGSANPVLLGDSIIYQNVSGNESSLWAYNTLTHTQTKLMTGPLSQFRFVEEYIYVKDDLAFFVSGSDDEFKFWRTDGTPAGTTALDSRSLYPVHSFIDGLMLSWSDNGTVLSTDGVQVVEHNLARPHINKSCVFNVNDVITMKDGLSNVGDAIIERSNNGVVSELSVGFPEVFDIRFNNVFNSAGNCIMLVQSFEGFKEMLVVAESGTTQYLSEQLDLTDIWRIFPYQNRVYAFKSADTNTPSSVVRFNSELTGFDAEYNFPPGFSATTVVSFSADYIITMSSTPNVSPRVNRVHFLDQNLVENENLGGISSSVPTVHKTSEGDLYSSINYTSNSNVFILSPTPEDNQNNVLKVSNEFVLSVITNPESAAVYLLIRDKITGQKSLAQLADKPNINQTTAGIWHDPSIMNQGLVINRGQRADGSDYLFVSAYTQQDGAAMWLAGVSNINLPQPTIDIQLTRYDGTNFFEPDATPNEYYWGRVTLEMTSCDGLQATFVSPDQPNQTVNLTRIDNSTYDAVCED